jgi:hypothetical protein
VLWFRQINRAQQRIKRCNTFSTTIFSVLVWCTQVNMMLVMLLWVRIQ